MSDLRTLESHFGQTILDPSTLLGAAAYAILLLALAALASRVLRHALHRVGARRSGPDGGPDGGPDRVVLDYTARIGRLVIYVFAAIVYAHVVPELNRVGTALLAGASVASVVIGLAAQGTLGNLVAGVALLLYRPFSAGDRLRLTTPDGVLTAVVTDLTLGYTILKTFDSRRVVVPNSQLNSQVLINPSMEEPDLLASVPVGVAYGSDLERARAALEGVGRAHPKVREVEGCPVTALNDSSVTLTLRVWCDDGADAATVTTDLLEAAVGALAEAGVEIPFPTRTVLLPTRASEPLATDAAPAPAPEAETP